ncbi:MAG: Gfo/Idh/MocA family oxidoreductase [candidate division Zixibacteria bacterium]|nr:Gfo/Idh/MocA family oxidoreductase [candidate division Zixibacteria bacterium]
MGRTNDDYLGIVLRYPEENMTSESAVRSVIIKAPGNSKPDRARIVGAVGTGGFSTGVLYPIISSMSHVETKHIVSGTGSKAVGAARQFNFERAGTSMEEMLADKKITSVIIATPHNLHAEQVIMALAAGKDVFVEKPLATTSLELDAILEAYKNNDGNLMVGLNRRFSPAAIAVKKHLAQISEPAMFTYRINAGFIPKDHPIQDSEIGKGRIIGEVCHFVDLITYLCGSEISSVSATGMTFKRNERLSTDNVQIQMTYKDGSVAAITYVACGGNGLAKERVEVHSMDKSFVIDDFKTAMMYSNGKVKKLYSGSQDKGHRREMEIFLSQGKCETDLNVALREAVMATEATFEIDRTLRTNSKSPKIEGWRRRMP